MTHATHTPGPWRITTDFIGVWDTNARRIADLGDEASPDTDIDEALANARLIAAAPDMLIALQSLILNYAAHGKVDQKFIMDCANLIEKAKGN